MKTWSAYTLSDLGSIAEELIPLALAHSPIWLFRGQMGAGKTTLVKELTRQLGVNGHVQSPTFALVNEYARPNGSDIYHFDLYRLKNAQEALDIGIGLSHDGPAQSYRGPDPLGDPEKLPQIKRWVSRRMPLDRMSFNTVLHRHNQSLKAVRQFFAEKLDLPVQSIVLATEEVMLPYDQGGFSLTLEGTDLDRYRHQMFWELVTGSGMSVGTMRDKVDEFMRAQAQSRPLNSLGQKCGMDRDDSIAVDMKGM